MNAFDFANLSDIAETNPELASKVANASQDKIDAVVGIFKKALEAEVSVLTIAQVQVAAIRLGIDLPATATVRKYINAAIEQKSLVKVTRQSYALVEAGVEADETAQEPDEDEDPLAGIADE